MKRWATAMITGLLIFTLGACSSKDEMITAPINRAAIANDKTTVTLGFYGGPEYLDGRIDVTETATALKIALSARVKKGTYTLKGVPYEITVKLRSPIGNKTLLDYAGDPIPIDSEPKPNPTPKTIPIVKVTFHK